METSSRARLSKETFKDEGGARPQEGDGENRAKFLELFAGVGGLTAAVVRAGLPAEPPVEVDTADLREAGVFKALRDRVRAGEVRWLHGAPPCKTFSSARRTDEFGSAPALRSAAAPEGLEPKGPLVVEANLLVRRLVALCRCMHRRGAWWSIENPASSLLWQFPPVADMASWPGVKWITGDQCCFGGEFRKRTTWCTNAEFVRVLEVACPGVPGHALHAPLRGFATVDGVRRWRTELAAEYPEDLCNALARAYAGALRDQPGFATVAPLVIEAGRRRGGGAPEDPRAARERENQAAIGGLRSTHVGLRQVPEWVNVGNRLRHVLGPFAAAAADDIHAALGVADAPEVQAALVLAARAAVAAEFGSSVEVSPGGVWAAGVGALTRAARDPDHVLATWLTGEVPLGIERPITPGGVFPLIEPTSIGSERDRLAYLAEFHRPELLRGNYSSYEEFRAEADQELRRELEAGFLTWDASRESLEQEFGTLHPARIAVLVKVKADGSKKVRLIHDLRRNGVNGRITVAERLVLPRVRDVVFGIMELFRGVEDPDEVELLALDFRDAFKQLRIHRDEKKYLSGEALNGFFVYNSVLFGVGSGPLVWGRVAAWAMRATQATLGPAARVNCYVDDPIVALRGRPAQRRADVALTVVLWSVLGLRAALPKGQFGKQVVWIGAELSVATRRRAVTVRIPEDKHKEVANILARLAGGTAGAQGRVRVADLRPLAGKLSWMAGLLPQLRPFVRQLWAAMASESGLRRDTLFYKQVSPAIAWLLRFFSGREGPLERHVHLVDLELQGLLIESDASPWGGGAAAWRGVVSRTNRRPPDAYVSTQWNSEDEQILGVRIGDPAGQAVWEAYMALLSIRHWVTPTVRGKIALVGDALGVWHSITRFAAKAKVVNEVAKEIAMHLAPMGHDLIGIHVWGVDNKLADQLSRMGPSDPVPAAVSQATRETLASRSASDWRYMCRAPERA